MTKMLGFTDDGIVPDMETPTYLNTEITVRHSTEADKETTWDLDDW